MGLLRSSDDRDARSRFEQERKQRDEHPARRFEYHVLRVGAKARAEGQLNELGARGWQLVEIVELPDHPWFVAGQFHPEFRSRPWAPHPLFAGFVGAALSHGRQ